MDVEIGEIESTVRVTDSSSLLSPKILEAIVQAVSARLREQLAQEKKLDADRRLGNRIFRADERREHT